MLDVSPLPIIIAVNSVEGLISLTNLFLVYAIWKHTPQVMGTFKWYMLKMAVTDLIFGICIGFLCRPNPVFPLPGLTCSGYSKYFGQLGCQIAYIFVIAFGGVTLVSVNDCCLYRVFLFYKWDQWLEKFTTFPSFLYFAAFSYVPAGYVAYALYTTPMTREQLYAYAKKAEMLDTLETLPIETPLLIFDPTTLKNILIFTPMMTWLGVEEGFNILFYKMVKKKIREAQASMSAESFRLQRSLTNVLIAQAVIPCVSISATFSLLITLLFFYPHPLTKVIIMSEPFQWGFLVVLNVYPFLNAVVCIYWVKPYRMFLKKCLHAVIPCWKFHEETVVLPMPSSSSGGAISSAMNLT